MSIYDFSLTRIDGSTQSMADFKGKVLLIVNTASKCGFTPQYQALQALYDKFGPERFAVLGFPCNQFGKQEQGDESEISQFCELNFGVNFPLFAKIEVNGDKTPPLYRYLKREAKGLLGSESIKWNFTKFLVDANGRVLERFAPTTTPESLTEKIAALVN
ncbi:MULTISPECIES: glutathione peroxidase [unclassified Shewanella]|uniref:glutathione peroxidase n=1 Tax=unclassified Shewanella TaxID=196818 RepID=UPI0005A1B7CD|nr:MULTISPECIES: glutathione peroxidase [unclassified Shewanella]KIO37158.1 glutathione peroxidase [Shewanella sp. cp20]MCG9723213.1 glutathione peroxidase [Shewanella sp. Isolate7]MCG9747258.1 glutathione peroxidase [Shewanella sp. Isolate8]